VSICENNYRLNLQAADERTYLNTGKTLRLYTAIASTLSPATVLADLTEATFTGYAGVSLSAAFAAQTKIIDGQYGISTGNLSFACTGGSPQTVIGYYVSDGTGVIFAEQFPAGVVMSNGGPSLLIALTYYQWARFILP